jgi:hypothetical protein
MRSLLFLCALLPIVQGQRFLGRKIARTMHWRGAEWLLRETREDDENVALSIDRLALAALRDSS